MKKNPELSCIIITLNEEEHISRLLKSLKQQTFQDFEVIVADFNSKDRTREVARGHGCTIVQGGKQSIARNAGARATRGKYLLFLDADGILKNKKFLETNLKRFKEKNAGIASVNVNPFEGDIIDWIMFGLYNFWITIMQKFDPHGTGACILVRRDVFKKIHGFDEKIVFAEDHEILKRAKKYKFVILPVPIYTSIRRLRKDGRLRTSIRYLYVFFYRTFYKEITEDFFNYNKTHKDGTK